jgi:Glycosyl hydrolases family 2
LIYSELFMDTDVTGRRATLPLDGLWACEREAPAARLGGEVKIPADWAGKRIHLIVDGAFPASEFLVDETAVAVHHDGGRETDVDLTDALGGRACFTLGVDAQALGARSSQSLAPEQDRREVWKSARLEARNPIHIAKVSVQTSLDSLAGVVSMRGDLSRAAPATTLQATLLRGGEQIVQSLYHFRTARFDSVIALPEAEPSSPETPNLYDLVIELIVGDVVVDSIERVVGFGGSTDSATGSP